MTFARTTLVVAAVLALSATAGASSVRWHEAGAPDGGAVNSVAIDDDGTLYAGTEIGLFIRRNGGRWERSALPGLSSTADVRDVAVGPAGTAYLAGFDEDYNGFVFTTSDRGVTWTSATNGLGEEPSLSDPTPVPGTPGLVYAVGPDGVYRTTDGGLNWQLRGEAQDQDTLDEPPAEGSEDDEGSEEDWGEGAATIAVDPASPTTIYAGGSRGIYTSTDAGEHWTKTGVGFPSSAWVIALVVSATTPRTFYAGTVENGVFKSVDAGRTWRPARAGMPKTGDGYAPVVDLALDPARPDVVYAATTLGAATTLDGGMSWRARGGADVPELSSLALDPRVPGGLVASSRDRGVLISADAGASWQQSNPGLAGVVPLAIASSPKAPHSVYLGTYSTGLVSTRDAGGTWSSAVGAPARTITGVVVDPRTPRTLYVGTSDRGVLKSRDGGATWASAGRAVMRQLPVARGLSPEVRALAINPRRPRILYAATQYRFGATIVRSADAGASWRRVFQTGGSTEDSLEALAVDPAHPATVYAGTGWLGNHSSFKDWGVFVSHDGGKTWKRVAAGIGSRKQRPGINALAVSPRSGDVYATTDIGVFRLQRGATTWKGVSAGLPKRGRTPVASWPIAINPRTGAVAVGTQVGAYELKGSGASPRWALASSRLRGLSVHALVFSADGSHLFVATPGRFFVSG